MLPSRNRIKPKAFFILKNFPKHKVLETEVDPLNKPRWASVTTQWLQKVKWSRYRPGVAQGMGRGIALLFHDRSTRRRWVVSSKPWPHFTSGKDPVPILQEAGWAPWPVWTGGKSRSHRESIPDHPARNRNEYQEYFLGWKGGRCVGLTTLPSSWADCLEIWEPQPRGSLRTCPDLYGDFFLRTQIWKL